MDSDALEAVRLLATRRLPGLVVTDQAGTPVTILPASQVVRLLVPVYVQEDPSLAGVLSESIADRIADKLGGKSVAAKWRRLWRATALPWLPSWAARESSA